MRLKKTIFPVAIVFLLNFISFSSVASLPVASTPGRIVYKDIAPQRELMLQQMKWFVKLTPSEYGKLMGKKLNFVEKISFNLSQHRMKRMLKHWDEPTTLQKISWFAKGLVLGPIAVLLAYIFLKDDERELIKWAWFGFATLAVVIGVLLLVL
jgi:hypothetical protein